MSYTSSQYTLSTHIYCLCIHTFSSIYCFVNTLLRCEFIRWVEGNGYELMLNEGRLLAPNQNMVIHVDPYGNASFSEINHHHNARQQQRHQLRCGHCNNGVSASCSNELCGRCCRNHGNYLQPPLTSLQPDFIPA